MSTGYITVKVFAAEKAMPVANAQIRITDQRIALDQTIYTDSFGNAERIRVYAPDKAASLKPQKASPPYETYNIQIIKDGYIPTTISNVQVFPGETCVQPVAMIPRPDGKMFLNLANKFEIPPNGLLLKNDRAAPEETRIPPANKPVVIPQNIRVHLGEPDSNAKTVNVPFSDYIKNAASSEIYATWPKESIAANILAIISLALNRIQTGFYPSQGKNFDVTSMPDRDPYFVDGRNTYANVNALADALFHTYVRRQESEVPLPAVYCDGVSSRCDGLSQWGSVTLANQGQNAEEILKYYYGNVRTKTTNDIQGAEKFPGLLRLGDIGENVTALQKKLNRIGETYANIPKIPKENGNYDAYTQDAVRAFQKQFQLSPDGIVGRSTWYQLEYVYDAVERLAKLDGLRKTINVPAAIPDETLREGSAGANVRLLQYLLYTAGIFFNSILQPEVNGEFGKDTADALISFQRTFSLPESAAADLATWNALFSVYRGIMREAQSVLDNISKNRNEPVKSAGEEPETGENTMPRLRRRDMEMPDDSRKGAPAAGNKEKQLRGEEEDRLRAAMNYANMDFVAPGAGNLNMAYSSQIKDYVPKSTTPGTMRYDDWFTGGNRDDKAGETPNAADLARRQKEKEPAEGTAVPETKPFSYTPWATDTEEPLKLSEPQKTDRRHEWDFIPEQLDQRRETDEIKSERKTGKTGMEFAPKEESEQKEEYPYRPWEPDLSGPGMPGANFSWEEPAEPREKQWDTGKERVNFQNTPGYPMRVPGKDPGSQFVPPGDDDSESYGCPEPPSADPMFPNAVLKIGSKGKNVQLMQEYLSYIALSLIRYGRDSALKVIVNDGVYGIDTTDAVIRFQNRYDLPVNGVVDAPTWKKIVEVYNNPCE